jgi:transposase
MTLTPEQRILDLHAQGYTRDDICATLHVGTHRVSRTIHLFEATGTIPSPRFGGRPRKVTDEILDYIDVRTLAAARLPSTRLAAEIRDKYGIPLSISTIVTRRREMGFRFRPPRHKQILRPEHLEARVAFCEEMLSQPQYLPVINFSDESRFVLGDDKRWIWYRRGEKNESAFHENTNLLHRSCFLL